MSDVETLRVARPRALESLELSRQRIDDLNVYPVPDGDTGTNLALTDARDRGGARRRRARPTGRRSRARRRGRR